MQSLTDHRESGRADATGQEQCRYLIRGMLGYLNDREQTIIARRFGLAGDKQTLVQVGPTTFLLLVNNTGKAPEGSVEEQLLSDFRAAKML